MDKYRIVNNLLVDICDAKENKIINRTYNVKNLTMQKMADVLIKQGKVYREDLENKTYVASIPGGIAKKHYAVVAIELQDNTLRIAVFAEEGIFNQHTSEGVLHEFENSIKEYIR
ncbi:MAG: hypothetical protein VZR24_13820 [Butyrivibrio hungatei]|nr:hypothetical protein [Butyrivibrio hungatei]